MNKEDLAYWKAYYEGLNIGLDPHNDWTHILDIIEALELAWAELAVLKSSPPDTLP